MSRERLTRWTLQMMMALTAAGAVYWLWPRLAVPRLGAEGAWFALGWLLLLAAPTALALYPERWPDPPDTITMPGEAYELGAFLLAGLFVILLLAASALANYKLWLGLVYVCAVTLRLTGLALGLRALLISQPQPRPSTLAVAIAIAFFAGLTMMPWVRPDLVAAGWPGLLALLQPLGGALLWGGVAGAVLFLSWRRTRGSRRIIWLAYLAVGVGPGPALAVAWLPLWLSGAVLISLAGLALLPRRGARAQATAEMTPMPLYWLLRALVLLWWGVGIAAALALAWWRPHVGAMFSQSHWLRALMLGGFLVACMGLLAEYVLPLLGRAEVDRLGPERKILGVMLSVLALLLALSPLVLMRPPSAAPDSEHILDRAGADLLRRPVVLDAGRRELIVRVPGWLDPMRRILMRRVFVISYLRNGAHLRQGQPVLEVLVGDDRDQFYNYLLRAGIDTAERELDRRSVAFVARHMPARVAFARAVHTPAGETYLARQYISGIYLGRNVERISSIRLRYVYSGARGKRPLQVVVSRVFYLEQPRERSPTRP